MALINLQKEALAAGKSNLVNDRNLYNSVKEFAKISEFKNYADFFTDPASTPAPQPAPDPRMIEVQTRLALEQAHAKANAAAQNNKVQSEMALARQKFELEREMALLKHELAVRDQQFRHLQGVLAPAPAAAPIGAAVNGAPTAGDPTNPDQAAGDPAMAAPAGAINAAPALNQAALLATLLEALRQVNAPKRVVRDAQGRVSHVEPMPIGPPTGIGSFPGQGA
jgi:hypothetical protein